MLNKELLQIFVCKIDAKLFKTISLEVLEAKDIKNTNCAFIRISDIRLVDGVVDLLHDVDEQPAVDTLSEGVPDVLGLVCVQGRHHGLTLDPDIQFKSLYQDYQKCLSRIKLNDVVFLNKCVLLL